MKTYRLAYPHNVFIEMNEGKIYAIEDQIEKLLKTHHQDSKSVFYYNGETFDLLNVVLESLGLEVSPSDRIQYRVSKSGYISPNSVKIYRSESNNEDEIMIFNWLCDRKANGANSRFKDKISKESVYQVLKLAEFKCVYCNSNLNNRDWHLDHYQPKAKGGRNVINNLVPSCRHCNMMKGSMVAEHFIKMCYRICMNNNVTNSAFLRRMESFNKNSHE